MIQIQAEVLSFASLEGNCYSLSNFTVSQDKTISGTSSTKPTPRCRHSAVIYSRYMYVFGGCLSNKKTLPANQLFYRLNLSTLQWECIEVTPGPSQRESHASVLHNHCMFIFGGSSYPNIYDDLWSFNFATNAWKKWQIKFKPKPRYSSTLISYKDRYLFLFGGIDMQHNVCVNSFLFDPQNGRWNQLKFYGDDCYRCFPAISSQKKVHIFGGSKNASMGDSVFKGTLSRELHQFSIDENHMEIASILICPPKTSSAPPGMVHHSMVALGLKYLLVFGGYIQVKPQGTITNDSLWVFNIFETTWSLLDRPANLIPKSKFSASIQQNSLYIFGGVVDKTYVCNELIVMSFPKIQSQRIQKREIKETLLQESLPYHSPSNDRHPSKPVQVHSLPSIVSASFVSAIAGIQKHPFSAVSHIVDCACKVKAQHIRICQKVRNQQIFYLCFDFPGTSLTNIQFLESLNYNQSSQSPIGDFGVKIKLGGFRLGKTILFIDRSKQSIKVALHSVNSNIVPDCDKKFAYFAYIQQVQTGQFATVLGKQNKQIIVNYLHSQTTQPLDLINNGSTFSLYIFEANVIVTSENTYAYELNFTEDDDVRPVENTKKIQFLNNLGYNVSAQPDVSLKTYLGLLYLNPTIKVYIGNSASPIPVIRYDQNLQALADSKVLTPLQIKLQEPAVISIKAYAITLYQDTLVHNNFGLLIYSGGRLLKRYKTNFGELFQTKFFKSKYRTKRFNLHRYLGILDFNPEILKVNILQTDFEFNHLSMSTWGLVKLNLKIQQAKLRPLNQRSSILLGMGTNANYSEIKQIGVNK